MNSVDPALAHFAQSLMEAVEAEDASRLREFLEGDLPAIGGDLDPADVIRRAVSLVDDSPRVARHLARMLAPVIAGEMEAIAPGNPIPPRRRNLLLSALYLAADLPAESDLFQRLTELLAKLRESVGDESLARLWTPLWKALVYQQTDASLEEEWFSLLSVSESEEPSPLLLTAWRGLLWIPPPPDKQSTGEIVDFDRVERGLLALNTCQERSTDAAPLLDSALRILTETYPRSAEFWSSHFESQTSKWPEPLKRAAIARWPALQPTVVSLEKVRQDFLQFQELVESRMARRIENMRSALAEMEKRREILELCTASMAAGLKKIQPLGPAEEELLRLEEEFEDFTRSLADKGREFESILDQQQAFLDKVSRHIASEDASSKSSVPIRRPTR